MVKRLRLKEQLTLGEIEQRYRRAGAAVARSQWQILWLLARGEATAAVVAATGYSATWIYQIVRRYDAEGAAGIGDRRHRNPGGGLWRGPAVASWLAARLGRPVGPQRGGAYLRRLGHTPQVPRPAQAQADPAAQKAFTRGASRTP